MNKVTRWTLLVRPWSVKVEQANELVNVKSESVDVRKCSLEMTTYVEHDVISTLIVEIETVL